jgi:hypothetical protein
MFETLNAVKLFFQEYAVCHHRPYYVAKSNKNVRYIIKCPISSCSWGVWIRHTKNEIQQWKVCTVKQPQTCGTSEVRHVHPQCTARFLGCRIMSIVWAQSDITVAALIGSVTAKLGGQRCMHWLFCGEIGENRTQKYRDC